jgi:hypothetical protein
MRQRFKFVSIRMDDYIAELLEREAQLLPSGFQENAKILRERVKFLRESIRTETVTIWKPVAKK